MGADMCVQYIDWKVGKTQEESDLHFGKMIADIEQRIHDLKEVTSEYADMYAAERKNSLRDFKDDLLDALENVRTAKDNARDVAVIRVGNRLAMITGGMTCGDSPSDTYEYLEKLFAAGVV